MRCDARDASIGRILLSICQTTFSDMASPCTLSPRFTGRNTRPSAKLAAEVQASNRDLHPDRHRNGAHAAMLANEIDDAPATVALLDMGERERGYLRSLESTAEEGRNITNR
jgi:hypothetical protein